MRDDGSTSWKSAFNIVIVVILLLYMGAGAGAIYRSMVDWCGHGRSHWIFHIVEVIGVISLVGISKICDNEAKSAQEKGYEDGYRDAEYDFKHYGRFHPFSDGQE